MKLAPHEHAPMQPHSSTRLEASSTVQEEMRRSSQDLSEFSSATKWRIPVVQQRTAAARAVPESEAKAKSQCRKFRRRSRFHSHSSPRIQCDQKSDGWSWKRPSESKELSVRLLSGLSTEQPVIKKAVEM